MEIEKKRSSKKEGHKWLPIKGNPTNFVCSICGIIGYTPKSAGLEESKDPEAMYDCAEYLSMKIMDS